MADPADDDIIMADPTGHKSPTEPLEPEEFLASYHRLTKITQTTPYHPDSWLERAGLFLGKYNELACADAYKALLLCGEIKRGQLPGPHLVMEMEVDEKNAFASLACWILFVALHELGEHSIAAGFQASIPEDFVEPSMPAGVSQNWDDSQKPKLARHKYPWSSGAIKPRQLDAYKKDLDFWDIKIKKATIGTQDDDFQGVFAKNVIKKGVSVLEDTIVKTNLPMGRRKKRPAMVLLDHVLANILSDDAKKDDAKKDNAKKADLRSLDILDMDSYNTLTIEYAAPADDFSFADIVENLASALLTRGLLFSPNFDFWRIFILYWQLCTNHFEVKFSIGLQVVGTAKLYSFFNHSCAPNVSWEARIFEDDKFDMLMKAERDLNEGEELFISYLGKKDLAKPVAARRRLLRAWFGADCLCKRCTREAGSSAKTQSAQLVGDATGESSGSATEDTDAESALSQENTKVVRKRKMMEAGLEHGSVQPPPFSRKTEQ